MTAAQRIPDEATARRCIIAICEKLRQQESPKAAEDLLRAVARLQDAAVARALKGR